ncbi:MAG: 50S ribosomal protein L24 [Erysipelotrichaceae bacterium]|nr:50S ribosomal protein L24 [Erysipelotrichaceae bacterium]
MKIKKGDKVKVIAGNDKGTVAEVTAVFPSKNKVIVEGVNIAKKALKPTQENPDGGIVNKEMPIDASNVMVYDSKSKQASRVGFKVEKGNKVRIYKKTGAEIKGGKK